MQVGFSELSYVPTIYLRPAELSAVEHLSDFDKDAIIPIFLLKPWANAKTIAKAIDKIEAVYSDRRYFVTCDPSYAKDGEPTAASVEFDELCDPKDHYEKWWQMLGNRPSAIPSIPPAADQAELAILMDRATELGRGFLVRITRQMTASVQAIAGALGHIDHNDYVVCLDVGWGRDILSSEMWADSAIKALIAVNENVRIVVSGSSFPREFTRYGTFGEESSLERILYSNLVKRNNQAQLIYGDWGSSRSSVSSGGGVVIPRIDVPRQRSWYIFRAASELGSYRATAKQAIDSKKWEYEPDVWGAYIIRNTSLGQGYVIDSPKKSTEARINIHLHEQIGRAPPGGQFVEEDFRD